MINSYTVALIHKKIIPEVFDTWSNILSRYDQSILWLMNIGKIAEKN